MHRVFFALPQSITDDDGHPVNALLGMANLILFVIERHEPRAVVLCWGAEAAPTTGPTPFPAYHADRPPLCRRARAPVARRARLLRGVRLDGAAVGDLEADDLLGTSRELEAEAGGRALLLTGDRDMYQCASDASPCSSSAPAARAPQRSTPAEVRERYGIEPEQVPDFIALRGDPSDGLPGAKGVGAKTAAELLREHGDLETLLDSAIRERRPKLREALIEASRGPARLQGHRDPAQRRRRAALPTAPTDGPAPLGQSSTTACTAWRAAERDSSIRSRPHAPADEAEGGDDRPGALEQHEAPWGPEPARTARIAEPIKLRVR